MTTRSPPHVVAAERLNDDCVIITFDDGKCAVYSATLLYATFTKARQIDESIQIPIDGKEAS